MAHAAYTFIILWFAAAARMFAAQAEWTGVERVVAVGDVHGDFAAFVEVLRSAGVIDQRDRWIGGKTHLVQTGDVPDRGPDTRKAMDLLMNLEKQAERAGGHVHALIGNHEAMNIYGDLRYTTPGEFAAFRTADSEQVRAAYYDRKNFEALRPLGWYEHRVEFGPRGTYGKWIRSHLTVIKINDTLYVHGGISPKCVSMPLNRINETIVAELTDLKKIKEGSLVQAEDGPLWYRGLALDEGPGIAAHVDQVLTTYGVKRIVVGHTVSRGAIIPRFGGKVIMIDAGLNALYGSNRAVFLQEGDSVYAIHRGEKIALPTDAGAALLAYLKKALSLEPAKSALAEYVATVEAGMGSAR
jgi:hypothetical protein